MIHRLKYIERRNTDCRSDGCNSFVPSTQSFKSQPKNRRGEERENRKKKKKMDRDVRERNFAANGVSLMNAFFVSGKQRRPRDVPGVGAGNCTVRQINSGLSRDREKDRSLYFYSRNDSIPIEFFSLTARNVPANRGGGDRPVVTSAHRGSDMNIYPRAFVF